MYICIDICIYVCTFKCEFHKKYLYIYVYVHMYNSIHVYIYMYISICIYIWMYMYIHMHIYIQQHNHQTNTCNSRGIFRVVEKNLSYSKRFSIVQSSSASIHTRKTSKTSFQQKKHRGSKKIELNVYKKKLYTRIHINRDQPSSD